MDQGFVRVFLGPLQGFPTSQRMASIALTSIGCIIYLALGKVLMHAMFRRWQREEKLDLFFPAKKAQDVRRGEVSGHNCDRSVTLIIWNFHYCLVWATKVALAAICLVFPALVLGYNFFIVENMTYQFLYRLKNLYDYRWQR